MATEAQVQANRLNAQKSTGPRTPEGKETAAQNALKHGLFTRETVIRGEDEEEFQEHRENLLEQLIPNTPLEEMLVLRIVDLSWRLKRAVQDQEKAFVTLYEKHVGREVAAEPAEQAQMIGRMIVEDFGQEAVLDRLLRYERRIEGSLYRTLNQLRRVHDQAQKALQEDSSILERWREEDWEARKARIFGSCPPEPRPTAEEVVRGRTTHEEGPPTPSTPFKGPQTPDGVTTNTQAGGQMRTTKPILEAASGLNCEAASEMCKTNPILDELSSLESPVSRKSCKTKPICEGVSNFK